MAERHDRRTTETRRLILLEAEKLYYIGGYENINPQVIADHLNPTDQREHIVNVLGMLLDGLARQGT